MRLVHQMVSHFKNLRTKNENRLAWSLRRSQNNNYDRTSVKACSIQTGIFLQGKKINKPWRFLRLLRKKDPPKM